MAVFSRSPIRVGVLGSRNRRPSLAAMHMDLSNGLTHPLTHSQTDDRTNGRIRIIRGRFRHRIASPLEVSMICTTFPHRNGRYGDSLHHDHDAAWMESSSSLENQSKTQVNAYTDDAWGSDFVTPVPHNRNRRHENSDGYLSWSDLAFCAARGGWAGGRTGRWAHEEQMDVGWRVTVIGGGVMNSQSVEHTIGFGRESDMML